MMKTGVEAQLRDIDKPPDREFLKGRYVKNCGTNIITISSDESFDFFLKENKKSPIKKTVLKPGATAWLNNFFVKVFTDDDKRAILPQTFDESGLDKLNKAYRSGIFKAL